MSKWEWKKLGDLYPIVMGKTPPRGNSSYWDKEKKTHNVWVSIADISANENGVIRDSKEYISNKAAKNIKLVSPDSLLVSFKLSIGKMAFTGVPLYTNEAIISLPPREDISLEYLHKYFLYFDWDKACSGDVKVKGKTLNKEKLKDIDVLVPPLSEQKRIVKFLDEEFSKIDTLKTNAETNLKNAKELFESKIEKSYSEKDSWKNIKLEDLVSCDCSLGYGIVQPGDEFPNGIPVVRPVDLTTKYVTRHNLKHVDPRISDGYKRTILKGGELLFCVRGTTGVVSIASAELNGCNVTRGISPLRFDNQETALYVYYYFQTKKASEEIKSKTKGTALKQINISDLRNISIPLPPLSVQKEIVARLDKLSENVKRLEVNNKQIIANCVEFKKSILKQTFQGGN